MNFADQKMVKKLRKEFPVGCRIVLDEMDDMARGNTAADTFWMNTNGRETTARR